MPIRYDRMLQSPFAFYRGAASIMASDLQGDAGVRYRGADLRRRASPELRRVRRRPSAGSSSTSNDFDETTIGRVGVGSSSGSRRASRSPARHLGLSRTRCAGRRARERAKLSGAHEPRTPSDRRAGRLVRTRGSTKTSSPVLVSERSQVRELRSLPRDNDVASCGRRSRPRSLDGSPSRWPTSRRTSFIRRMTAAITKITMRGLFEAYARSLPLGTPAQPLRRAIRFVDAAYKVVGVGSVGTRCSVALFVANESDGSDTLWLQVERGARVGVRAVRTRRNGSESRRARGGRPTAPADRRAISFSAGLSPTTGVLSTCASCTT